jgi:large subunit ribosomal protein L24
MKIKKGDKVIVLSGKEKGKKGTVIRAFPKENKVVLEGLNMLKKSRRPRKQGEKGSIVDMAMPIHVSNVKKVD